MAAGESIRTERDGTLKIIKRLLYFIVALIMMMCAFILLCAFNPSLTERIAGKVTQKTEVQRETEGEQGASGDNSGSISVQAGTGVYVPPAQENVTTPASVKDKNGYEPVWEDGEQVADDEAESIQEELGTGESGEDFTFDTEFYPYYGMLDRDMRTLYRQIYANAMEMKTSFAPAVEVTADEVRDVFEAVYNDHPELFWLETSYSCKYLQSGKCIELTLRYNKAANDLEESKRQFEAAADRILTGAKELSGDAEKEKYIHDTLIEQVAYHAGTDMNQSAYSALVEGRSVCAGYARAFQYLMMELGIPCYYCTGYSGEDHAWNIVKLDDDYYNVDVTWDDTEPSTCDYFNKTDADYAQTHMRTGLSVNLPACNGERYRKGGIGSSVFDEINQDGDTAGQEDLLNAETEDLINDNPQTPLVWTGNDAERALEQDLEEAGITEDEVMDTLEEYYADCLQQMKKQGSGMQQFTNVIPTELWDTIEQEYSSGKYEKGYVEDALKELKMDHFAIQLQTVRLSGKYYKLYHNVSTWVEEE